WATGRIRRSGPSFTVVRPVRSAWAAGADRGGLSPRWRLPGSPPARTHLCAGYCCLFVKRHAVELHDLTEAEGAAYMRDIQKVSRALQTVTGAVKRNWSGAVRPAPLAVLEIGCSTAFASSGLRGRRRCARARKARHEYYAFS